MCQIPSILLLWPFVPPPSYEQVTSPLYILYIIPKMKSKSSFHSNTKPLFHVVLVKPEIPQNTGNIGRTCVGTCSHLHLVGPLGFELSDKQVKRAGLDYWPHLHWSQYNNWSQWWNQVNQPERIFFFSTKAKKNFYDIKLRRGDFLVFGSETRGLPPEIIATYKNQLVKIPFLGPIRSFNLANTVSMALGEGLRQMAPLSPL